MVEKSSSVRGKLPVAAILAAAGCLLLAPQVVSVGMSQHLAQSAPEEALRWRPNNPAALSKLAEQNLASYALEDAARNAREAIALSPLATNAYRVLAQTLVLQGAGDQSARLMRQTGKLTHRDPHVSLWLYRDAMATGRYSEAFHQADATMRRAPGITGLLARELAVSIADPAAISPLVARLATEPPWRGAFMRELAKSAPAPLLAIDLLQELSESDAPATDQEVGPILTAMVSRGDLELAYAAWVGLLPPDLRPKSRGLYNGDFVLPAGPAPFGWALATSGDGTAKLEPSEIAGLQVSHSGFSDATVARQLMLLAPGRYRLSSNASLLEGATMELEWRIGCDARARLIALTMPLDSAGGKALGEFAVGEGCPAQRLSLTVRGSDRRSPTMATVAKVQVQRLGDL